MANPKAKLRIKKLSARAERLIGQPRVLIKKLSEARGKAGRSRRRELDTIKSDLIVLIDFAQDVARGTYKGIDLKTSVMVTAAILYFLMPLDSIPDFILGLGYLDDVTVITFVLSQIQTEIEKYKIWRQRQNPSPDPNSVIDSDSDSDSDRDKNHDS